MEARGEILHQRQPTLAKNSSICQVKYFTEINQGRTGMKHALSRSIFEQCCCKTKEQASSIGAAHQPTDKFSLLTSFQTLLLQKEEKVPLLPLKISVLLRLQWSKQFLLGLWTKCKDNAKGILNWSEKKGKWNERECFLTVWALKGLSTHKGLECNSPSHLRAQLTSWDTLFSLEVYGICYSSVHFTASAKTVPICASNHSLGEDPVCEWQNWVSCKRSWRPSSLTTTQHHYSH